MISRTNLDLAAGFGAGLLSYLVLSWLSRGEKEAPVSEIVRAALVQQQWTGDKDSMIRASADAIGRAASAGAQVACLQELFYGPYFCQVQDADYYSYTEAIPGGPKSTCVRAVSPT